MRSNTKNGGFHVVEVVLIVGVLALIGFIGYRVWQARQTATKTPTSQTASVPTVQSSKDLDTASSFVNQINTSADLSDLTKLQQDLDSLGS